MQSFWTTTLASKPTPSFPWLAIGHDIQPYTVKTHTQFMIDTAKKLGYQFVTVGDCLGQPPGEWYRSVDKGEAIPNPPGWSPPPPNPLATASLTSSGTTGPTKGPTAGTGTGTGSGGLGPTKGPESNLGPKVLSSSLSGVLWAVLSALAGAAVLSTAT